MITGIDYILYTQKRKGVFIHEMKKSFSLWDNPYFVIEAEDETTDIYVAQSKAMFDLMDEKGFYIDKISDECLFLIIFNNSYTKERHRITLILPKNIETSKFTRKVFNWLKSIL